MSYRVVLSKQALKTLKKTDPHQAKILLAWIEKYLEGCNDPRAQGKALTGNRQGFWRYRVGAYRLVAAIHDAVVQIEIINIAHRRDVYK